MKFFKIVLVALIAIMSITVIPAYAANIYKDAYTTEDSSGNWTFTNYDSQGQKSSIHTIATTADTTGSVTAARTGNTWVFRGNSMSNMVLLLPTAATGLKYTFISATTTSVSVKANSGDKIIYGVLTDMTNGDKLTSPATYCSVELVAGNADNWYVANMTGTWTNGGA